MSAANFCPEHGPYTENTCPWCAAPPGRPAAPSPLEEDDMPTEAFVGHSDQRRGAEGYQGGDETEPPRRVGILDGEDYDETEMPSRRRRERILDGHDYDELDETVLDREDTSFMGWLIVKKSQYMRRGHIMKIRSGAIWGRDNKKADIVIDDEKVSGIHARIQLKDDNFVVHDLGSANGTWVNNEEIQSPVVLNENDEIKIGDTILVLKTLN